ncbi:DUF4258 domain-containing protein [Devosia albogilva]|uniref:DUF4258 domain-containing protein n=1 Tax=Devosia albogilva TaxID=429726 RepID=A0ABW5QJX3_9HYPH
MAPTLVYTQHALDVLRERELQRAWVEATLAAPDWVEPDPSRPGTRRFYRALPERQGRYLRVVVVVETATEIRILTAFLDRGAKPK